MTIVGLSSNNTRAFLDFKEMMVIKNVKKAHQINDINPQKRCFSYRGYLRRDRTN